jgi:ABC-type sulfate transport system substrate-binding protein
MTPADTTFADWLSSYGSGALDDKLTAAMADVAQQVLLLDKTGRITLTLHIAPQGGGVIVTADVKAVAPEAKKTGQFFYVTPAGALSRRDPAQPQLPTMEDNDA